MLDPVVTPRTTWARVRGGGTQVLAGMRTLGLQQSLTCDGVLQSARSIESALQSSSSSIGVTSSGSSSREAMAAREAALKRSHELLRFVDHHADQLLLSSGESGRWFVEPSRAGGNGHGRPRGQTPDAKSGRVGVHGDEGVEVSGSSGSESDEEVYSDSELMDLEERREDWESRDGRARDREAQAAPRPPPNAFVEELNSISWLPVRAQPPSDFMPWKVERTATCLPIGGRAGRGGGRGC